MNLNQLVSRLSSCRRQSTVITDDPPDLDNTELKDRSSKQKLRNQDFRLLLHGTLPSK